MNDELNPLKQEQSDWEKRWEVYTAAGEVLLKEYRRRRDRIRRIEDREEARAAGITVKVLKARRIVEEEAARQTRFEEWTKSPYYLARQEEIAAQERERAEFEAWRA